MGARYGVELRDAALMTPAYGAVLAARGAAHVYNSRPRCRCRKSKRPGFPWTTRRLR